MDGPYAMGWAGFENEDRALIAAFELMFARNTKETLNALKKYDTLAASAVFATVFLL